MLLRPATALVLLLSTLLSATPSLAEHRNRYAPPPGMSLLERGSGHGLALRRESEVTDPRYLRQVVRFRTTDAPGTIVISTEHHFLFLVLGDNKALRYGIGVAREGFEWTGVERISNKREWPSWTPPAEMRQRRPDLPRFMEGGPDNPLGARALYLGSTLYRIHGTNEPWSIGGDVSSGCIRMTNEDVIDLYDRVRIGARVVVL